MNVDSVANATSSMKIDSNGEERRKKTETLKTDDLSRKKMIIAYLEGDSAAAAGKLHGIRPRMAQLIISVWQKSQNAMVVPEKGARTTSSPIELSDESRKALVDELDRHPDILVEELQDFFGSSLTSSNAPDKSSTRSAAFSGSSDSSGLSKSL